MQINRLKVSTAVGVRGGSGGGGSGGRCDAAPAEPDEGGAGGTTVDAAHNDPARRRTPAITGGLGQRRNIPKGH